MTAPKSYTTAKRLQTYINAAKAVGLETTAVEINGRTIVLSFSKSNMSTSNPADLEAP